MKSWKSVISFLLVLVFIVQLLPLSSIAIELEMPKLPEVTGNVPEEAESTPNTTSATDVNDAPYVIGEVEERREESVKHFRMSDGSFSLIQFSEPVHWKDTSGAWKEIDNTLTLQNGRYVAQNGTITKSFAASMGDGELVRVSNGDYAIGMTYVVPATSEKADQSSDPDEAAESQEQEEDPASDADVADSTDDDAASQESEGSDSAPEAEPEETAPPEPQAEQNTDAPVFGTSYVVRQDASVKAAVENTPQRARSNLSVSDAIKGQTSPSKVQYTDADQSIDFLYENHGYNVKESILIQERQEQYSYSFALDLTGLTPKLQDDGSILLQNKDGDAIFSIPAPVIEDANGATSDAAKYTIANENDCWILTVEADSNWVNQDDRAFPVKLDPSIIAQYGSNTVYSTYVRSFVPNMMGSDQEMYCGYNVSAGHCRVALQITNLPPIPTDCTPVEVKIGMHHAAYYNSSAIGSTAPSTPMLVEAHELTDGVMSIGTQTWNSLNPKVTSTVIDYQKLTQSTCGTYVYWDISSAGLKWYSNGSTNRGLIFIAPDAYNQDPEEGQTANISGSYFVSYGPVLIVTYRSAVGIEPFYSYQTVSASRAGDVSINDFTNQMTVVHTDLVFNSEATPFTLAHVYNSEHANQQFSSTAGINTCDFSAMVVGAGWKLSAQQTIISRVIGDTTYLIYNDEDGTDHYFYPTAYNTYEDEDGLNLKIVKSGATYIMTDEDANNTWTFYNGYLISHRDLVGNMIYYAYNSNYSTSGTAWKPTTGSSNQLVEIVSVPVGQSPTTICTFGYTGWFLTSVRDYAERITTFSIQGENSRNILKYIQHTDTTQARYEYYSDSGRMNQIYDTEAKYGLTISEQTRQGKLTVDAVREYTSPSAYGSKTFGNGFTAFRHSSSLTSYRFYGPDHTKDGDNGGDDTILFSVLDHWGRTICAYETDSKKEAMLGTTAGSYTANTGTSKKNNRLTSASALGLQAENIIEDGGVELANTSYWTPSGTSSTATATVVDTAQYTHLGKGALHCTLSANPPTDQSVSFYQDAVLQQGTTYVFSGYINTYFSTVPSTDSGAYLQISTTHGGQTQKSTVINYSTYTSQSGDGIDNFDCGWEKVSVTFTPASTAQYRLSFVLRGVEGSAYADDFQLERRSAESVQNSNTGASSTNLLNFGSFDGAFQEVTYNWTGSGFSSEPSHFLLGTYCVKVDGNSGSQRRLSQTVPIYRSAANLTFVLSGWGKADSIASAVPEPSSACWRYFGLIATIHYSDHTTEDHYVSFSPDYSSWQFASGNIVPKEPTKVVTSITVSCAYDYNCNTAMFDNISLVREPMQTYAYDNEGNLSAATDGNAQSSVQYISGTHRPSSYITPNGVSHTLTYTANKQLATETVGGVTASYDYNGFGNPTSVTVTGDTRTANYLQASNEYSSDGHYPISSEDVNGIKTTNSYDTIHRRILTTKTGDEAIQSYAYFQDSDRLQQTYISGKASIFYTYENAALTQLRRKSFNGSAAFYQRYDMTNDSFGNTTAVEVLGSTDGDNWSSSITLMSYTYESGVNNGRLTSMSYPNGDAVTYSYDLFDRITEETYTGTDPGTRSYVYDGTGNLAEKTMTRGTDTERHVYQYDGLGRLYHSCAYWNGAQTIGTSYLYDVANRPKEQSWTIGTNIAFKEKYQYSASDDTLSSLTVHTDIPDRVSTMADITAVYSYTPIRQIQKQSFQYAGGEQFYRAFAYRTDSTTHQTTNQVEYINYRMPNDTLILGYKYGYDSSGRINSVMPTTSTGVDTTKAVTYSYDSMGRLTGCVDKSSGSTVNYSYTIDTAGNIRTATKGGTTINYAYENAAWPDLLTKVTIGSTEKTISYTTPGLPNNWYNGSEYAFTWKQGNKLATIQKSGTTTSYSYDMDGIRSSKTVGSTTYHFDTLSGKVMHQTGAARELWFIYDESGQPYMMISKHGTTVWEYWYLLNAQGDVVGIVNRYRQLVAKYSYDPYGKITSEWINPNDTVGEINPLRYRGYFYDFETGFYYLQSRYYDPVIGRFISADCSYASTGQGFIGCNMFAYCNTDPVNRKDPNGKWTIAITITIGGSAGGGASISFGWVIDSHLNIARIETNGFRAGTPDANFSGNLTVSNADTIYDLEGNGITVGGSVSLPVSVGGDICLSNSPITGKNVTAVSLSLGGGLAPAELHATYGTTAVVNPTNLRGTGNRHSGVIISPKVIVKPHSRFIRRGYTK